MKRSQPSRLHGFYLKPHKPACVFAHTPGLLLHRMFAAKRTAHLAFKGRVLRKSERTYVLYVFKNFTLINPHNDTVWVICTEGTFEISLSKILPQHVHVKTIPKLSSSSLRLLHSLRPYYTAI